MKFDINKEFSFSQIFDFLKEKSGSFRAAVKKLDSGSVKNLNIKGRVVRINALRLGLLAAVLAILLGLFINLVVLPNTAYRPYSGIEFDTGGDYEQIAFGDDLLLLNKNGIKLIDNKGGYIWEESMTLTNPTVDIAGKYALLADLEGNCSLNLYNLKGKKLVTYPINTEILSAKVNKSGKAAAAVTAEGYKGAAVVFDRKGNEIFRWNSGEGYIIDLDISSDGKSIAVAQMMSDGAETYSKIHVINISSGNESGSYVCEGSLVASVTFDDSGRIIAVAQNKVYGLNKKGAEKFVIDLAGKSAERYDVTGGERMLFLCRDNRGGTVLEIYNKNGKQTGVFNGCDDIKRIACTGDTIVVSNSRSVMRVSGCGRLRRTTEIEHDIMSVGVYGNGRNALALGGNCADIVRIR